MEKRTPIQKSIVRHKLKEIDRRPVHKVALPAPHKALSNAEKALKLHQIMAEKEHNRGGFEERLNRLAKSRKQHE